MNMHNLQLNVVFNIFPNSLQLGIFFVSLHDSERKTCLRSFITVFALKRFIVLFVFIYMISHMEF